MLLEGPLFRKMLFLLAFCLLIRTFALAMGTFIEKYRRFKEWQKQPYQVKPLSQEAHDCPTCGTHFEGNYCPRCGQSAMIGRYSFKKAFLLFLDVWGLGNRGMFRTLRDLILRPGYMIRDYLQGMQMAYFPPFKMFFLLTALSILVDTSLNIKMENRTQVVYEQISQNMNQALKEKIQNAEEDTQQAIEKGQEATNDLSQGIYDWVMKHISVVMIVLLLLLSGPLYLFFRKSPAYPDIKYSEFFVTMVYITNMLAIYSIVLNFFCLGPIVESCIYVLTIIPLKQLSGYSYWVTILKTLLAFLIFIVFFVAASLLIGGVVNFIYYQLA